MNLDLPEPMVLLQARTIQLWRSRGYIQKEKSKEARKKKKGVQSKEKSRTMLVSHGGEEPKALRLTRKPRRRSFRCGLHRRNHYWKGKESSGSIAQATCRSLGSSRRWWGRRFLREDAAQPSGVLWRTKGVKHHPWSFGFLSEASASRVMLLKWGECGYPMPISSIPKCRATLDSFLSFCEEPEYAGH